MTAFFYGWGLGLFGHLSRIQLWIPVVAMWALMLLWSKPWLDRFSYGPFEWLWRSLARWQLAADAKRRALRSSLEPAEILVARLLAEAAAAALGERVGRFFEQAYGLEIEHPQLDDLRDEFAGKGMGIRARPRRAVSISSARSRQRLGAELARFALQRMGGNHQRGGILSCIACSIWLTDLVPSSRK